MSHLIFSRIADRQVESHSIQVRIYIAFSIRVSHLLDIWYLFVYPSILSCIESVPLWFLWQLAVNSEPSSRVRIEAKPREVQFVC